MLSALTYPDDQQVLQALFTTFTPDCATNPLYPEMIAVLIPAARQYLEHLMSSTAWIYESEHISDFARKHYTDGKTEGRIEGITEGKAEDILAVLSARGITIPEHLRTRVSTCTDPAQLDTWLISAATATTLTDVFD